MNGESDDDMTIQIEELPPARSLLRIALVTESYPPEVNGVALSVARMAEGLRARGHSLHVARLRQPASLGVDANAGDLQLRGLPIPRYPGLQMGLPCSRTLERHWLMRRPDVVHVATEGPLGWSALRAARRLKLPVVSDFRTNFHAYSAHYGIGFLSKPIVGLLRKFHNRTLATLVPTHALARELAALRFERLQVVSRGVDTRRFDPARRSHELRQTWGAQPSTRVLLCVSRLAPEKNLALVGEAYLHAKQTIGPCADLKLVFVGDGPSRAELQARFPDAVFAGMRRGDDLAAHYASADLFVFPSLTETYGNVVPEALASGLPVIAYNTAAAAELIQHAEQGLLAAPGDDAEFVRWTLQALLEERLDEMGRAARATAARLDWERVIDRLESVLCQATDTVAHARHYAARLLPIGT